MLETFHGLKQNTKEKKHGKTPKKGLPPPYYSGDSVWEAFGPSQVWQLLQEHDILKPDSGYRHARLENLVLKQPLTRRFAPAGLEVGVDRWPLGEVTYVAPIISEDAKRGFAHDENPIFHKPERAHSWAPKLSNYMDGTLVFEPDVWFNDSFFNKLGLPLSASWSDIVDKLTEKEREARKRADILAVVVCGDVEGWPPEDGWITEFPSEASYHYTEEKRPKRKLKAKRKKEDHKDHHKPYPHPDEDAELNFEHSLLMPICVLYLEKKDVQPVVTKTSTTTPAQSEFSNPNRKAKQAKQPKQTTKEELSDEEDTRKKKKGGKKGGGKKGKWADYDDDVESEPEEQPQPTKKEHTSKGKDKDRTKARNKQRDRKQAGW